MIINEAIFTVLKDVGVSTDDYRFPKRYIYRKLKITANELIRQDYGVLIGGGQTLDCVDMKEADRDDCKEYDGEFTLLKSCKPIPKPLDTKQGDAISGIFTLSGRRIQYGSFLQFTDSKKRRFQKCSPDPFAFTKNDHLYVADNDVVDCLTLSVEGFYDNPEDVAYFNEPSGCTPVFMREFEVPGYLARRVILIVSNEIRGELPLPVDTTNNGKDDTTVQQQQNTR